mmetsp:Transcript_17274/g.30823  ORF Transcript_17274/g.30823 Transcript_17274/m.30823 type:complete len:204 (-) Transcript_17274:1031-1642(-)
MQRRRSCAVSSPIAASWLLLTTCPSWTFSAQGWSSTSCSAGSCRSATVTSSPSRRTAAALMSRSLTRGGGCRCPPLGGGGSPVCWTSTPANAPAPRRSWTAPGSATGHCAPPRRQWTRCRCWLTPPAAPTSKWGCSSWPALMRTQIQMSCLTTHTPSHALPREPRGPHVPHEPPRTTVRAPTPDLPPVCPIHGPQQPCCDPLS